MRWLKRLCRWTWWIFFTSKTGKNQAISKQLIRGMTKKSCCKMFCEKINEFRLNGKLTFVDNYLIREKCVLHWSRTISTYTVRARTIFFLQTTVVFLLFPAITWQCQKRVNAYMEMLKVVIPTYFQNVRQWGIQEFFQERNKQEDSTKSIWHICHKFKFLYDCLREPFSHGTPLIGLIIVNVYLW